MQQPMCLELASLGFYSEVFYVGKGLVKMVLGGKGWYRYRFGVVLVDPTLLLLTAAWHPAP